VRYPNNLQPLVRDDVVPLRRRGVVEFSRAVCVVALFSCSAPAFAQRRAGLPPLLEFLDGTSVETRADWGRRRAEIRRLMCDVFIGSFPGRVPAVIGIETLEASETGTRRRLRVTLDTPHRRSFEVRVSVPPGDGPFPLLLTQPRYYQIPWAELALARGWAVCLWPGLDSHHREKDFPGWDSVWQTFRTEYPDATWTEISTKAWLASRSIDALLDARSPVKIARGQIGIIGFSRYGKQAMVAAAFDERITSVVARSPGSPASCPYRFTSRDTFAEAPADFPSEWFLPSLRAFTGREDELPIDAHGWYALIAPRRCLVHTAHNDGAEPTFAVERAYLEGRKVYAFLGASDNLRVSYRVGQHGPITDEHRRENLDWLDLSAGRGTVRQEDFPEALLHHFEWQEWKVATPAAELRVPAGGAEPRNDAERRARIAWMLGAPATDNASPATPEFLTAAESAMMTHDRWAPAGVQRVPVRFGHGVRGNVYAPTAPKASEGGAPAVIWLHPFSYHSGYNEGYGVQGTTVYHRLAQRGCVVLAYDQCGFGLRLLEGRDFYARHPRSSRFGRMVADARAAVDSLIDARGSSQQPLPKIDPRRVFLLGYSIGGLVALHAAALDDRVAGVASFSGLLPLRSGGDAARRFYEWHALLPKLGLFRGREKDAPYDLDDVLALVAPRPCLVVAPKRDRDADIDDVTRCVERARTAWERRGATAALEFRTPDDVSRFQRDQHEVFLGWLDRLSAWDDRARRRP